MYKAPELLDPKVIDAAMQRSRKLRSEAAYDIGISIRNAVRRLFGLTAKSQTAEAVASKPSVLDKCVNLVKANSPLERGLQAGWY
jgi:hypothetical protein